MSAARRTTRPDATATATAQATAPREARPRNPWAATFLSPVPIAFAVGAAGTALVGAVLAPFGAPALTGWQPALTGGLVALFGMSAIGRLIPGVRAGLVRMVPPSLPRPDLIVAATGLLEAAGAIGLLIPAMHAAAALCLALLLVAVFPANVRAAKLGTETVGSLASPLLPRTVEQVLWIAVCLAVAFG